VAMHVYLAGENHAAPHSSLRHIQWSLRSRSSGKGTTDMQAKASALCEALERYSGVFQGTEPRRTATFAKLDGLAVHPNACMLFSERQFDRRADINAEGSRFCYVPLPFDEDADIEWSPIWSMTHKIFRYLPTEYCYYDYPAPEGRRYSVGCSNGNAAGNTAEEAILHGFLELVERDAVALWWYPRARRPAVDLDSFDEPYVHHLRAFLDARHRDVWVLDVTSDLGLPTFVAVSRRTNHPNEHIMVGFGTHLDARSALLRALTELTQSLTWVLGPINDGIERIEALQDDELQRWLTKATIANQPYLAPFPDAARRTASDYHAQWNDDLKDDVLFCQDLVAKRGMEMLVLDQTRSDIGLPVVKVMVPGLRHFWPRFAPGRLYDVPPSLGWVPEPVAEDRLNPVSMFI
jgi:thiazole/oxazole-forming peptide maturase SagD family component